jgi:hypothetical protein
MKLLYLAIAFVLLFPGRIWSATITAVGSGNWTNNAVWSCNCQPTNSDDIVIPSGRTITANSPIILFFGPVITITVAGTLSLQNTSLQLDASDVVNIVSGGKIMGTGALGGLIFSGVTPIPVTPGSSINGPISVSNGVLPIKLIYFRSTTVDDGIKLEWASAEEKNFDYYDIARSEDGTSFTSIARVTGKN